MKRGVTPLISWVLLVGMVVALAVVVTNWAREHTESTTEQLVEDTESDIRCAEVSLNVNLDCTSPIIQMALGNKGKFTIHKIIIRQTSNTERRLIDLAPTTTGTESLNSFNPSEEADVIPIILLGSDEAICSARKVVVNC